MVSRRKPKFFFRSQTTIEKPKNEQKEFYLFISSRNRKDETQWIMVLPENMRL